MRNEQTLCTSIFFSLSRLPARPDPRSVGIDPAFPRICASRAWRGFRYGGEASRPLHEDGRANLSQPSHEEDSMTRRTSSYPFMRTQAASLTGALMGTGRSDGTAPRGRRTEDSEFLKNTIKLDKFTGFFDKFLKINRPEEALQGVEIQ